MMFVNVFLIFTTLNFIAHVGYYLATIRYTTINEMIVDFLAMEILVFLASVIVFAADIIGDITK